MTGLDRDLATNAALDVQYLVPLADEPLAGTGPEELALLITQMQRRSTTHTRTAG